MDTVFGSADRALVARDGTTTTVSAALADKAVVGLYFGPLVPPEPRLHPQACARLPEDQHREAVRGRLCLKRSGRSRGPRLRKGNAVARAALWRARIEARAEARRGQQEIAPTPRATPGV